MLLVILRRWPWMLLMGSVLWISRLIYDTA